MPTHQQLYTRLNYHFNDKMLLNIALTHRSVGKPNNERLEFLGDAILSYIIGEALYEAFPKAREGELTRMRAHLVKGETLAHIARQLELGQFLLLGGGELKSGGWRRASILADTLEAVFGAIYQDGGMDACKKTVFHLFADRLNSISPKDFGKDPKTRLQEYLQSHKQVLPQYEVLTINGTPHDQWFEITCTVPGLAEPIHGEGKTRRFAEQAAAAKALQQLTHD
jgi:ribonuclease-3